MRATSTSSGRNTKHDNEWKKELSITPEAPGEGTFYFTERVISGTELGHISLKQG